jgi:hypothetical protein
MNARPSVAFLLATGLLLTAAAQAAPPTDAESQAWAKAGTPGPQHARLAELAGTWHYSLTIWGHPGDEPVRAGGTSRKTMILGGRFLQDETTGESFGMPFHGLGLIGHDNVEDRLVSTWTDNMGTGLLMVTGAFADDGSMILRGSVLDPVTREHDAIRMVTRFLDRDHHVFESYVTPPGGSEHLQMRCEYARLPDPPASGPRVE